MNVLRNMKWLSVSRLNYSRSRKMSVNNESFLTGNSGQYIEDMYNAWLKDPSSVHVSWDSYFRNAQYIAPPNLAPTQRNEVPLSAYTAASPGGAKSPLGGSVSAAPSDVQNHLALHALFYTYQAHGHLLADLDPLGILPKRTEMFSDVLSGFEMDESANEKVFPLPFFSYLGGDKTELPLKEIIRRLKEAYSKHIGVEYAYLFSAEQRIFMRTRIEKPDAMQMTKAEKLACLGRLIYASEFELFLARKWASVKRFGLEGCEMLIPAILQIIDKSSAAGVDHVFIALAHRGRLNLLVNVCKKPLYQLFTQFRGLEAADEGSGDVKYHLGSYTMRTIKATNRSMKVTLMSNPSHLEAVDSVMLGRARAEMFIQGDLKGDRVLPIMIHGDASFCGQGIVYESLHLSDLPCYTCHGTIHIVLNNQVGFTTDPRFQRSSPYCSDVGKVTNAPILHVNADQPEAVIHVSNIASEWRSKFKKDVVIDLVGYRRNGHNEADEPMFTQPLMYTKIKNHKPVQDQYIQKVLDEKLVTPQEVKKIKDDFIKYCEDEFEKASKETKVHFKEWLDSPWSGFFEGSKQFVMKPTGVAEATLQHIGEKFSSPPPPALNFVVHKGIERILKLRKDMVATKTIDWALGEAMAYGSLLKDGVHVRLSGEDVERGTFSHRHHVLHHQSQDKVTYNMLDHLYEDQAKYTVCNSSLSEYGVLGFEVGYAQASPHQLIMWEAQFGDFANTAQCIIDQFISSGQSKWARQNGIVLLLPHGYEGMGPEHSCARPERFLQMSSDDPDEPPEFGADFVAKQLYNINWIVANLTTPANLFHALRRQVAINFRKPLVIMTPKSLLRHPEARSSFSDMVEGTEFQRVIPERGDASKSPGDVKKLIFCSGKVYYDIAGERKKQNLEKAIAISRLEQVCPFPYDLVLDECKKYANAKVFFCQEEPKNHGFVSYVYPRLFSNCLKGQRPVGYIGRPPNASPATGSKAQHDREVANMYKSAMAL